MADLNRGVPKDSTPSRNGRDASRVCVEETQYTRNKTNPAKATSSSRAQPLEGAASCVSRPTRIDYGLPTRHTPASRSRNNPAGCAALGMANLDFPPSSLTLSGAPRYCNPGKPSPAVSARPGRRR